MINSKVLILLAITLCLGLSCSKSPESHRSSGDSALTYSSSKEKGVQRFPASRSQGNQVCLKTSSNSCDCPSRTISVEETFALPGSGNRGQIRTCHRLDLNAFNACLSSLLKAPEKCNCNEKARCLADEDSTPKTLQVGSVAPANCGYKWRGFNWQRYKREVPRFLETGVINCSHSMCTSAVFLAWVAHAKKLREQGKISQSKYVEMTTPGAKAYRILNEAAEPNELVEAYGLGTGSIQYASEGIGRSGSTPMGGDLVQIWRKNGSGHSVIFKGFLDTDGDGRNDRLCYWSSQNKTNGYGNRCETIRDMDRILIGSLNG